ncbi:MAG: 2OG-Fe(II) oxygenase [Bacteroidales bacterium]|nr:2OG-Fe(II) oxygenase [Bacteroidales bacterium]
MGKSRRNPSTVPSLKQTLVMAVQKATQSAQFVVHGTLPITDPGLSVTGLGRITFPLKRKAERSLIAACQVAPYGKGTETLVDERVRKTFELDPTQFTLSPEWNTAIAEVTRTTAQSLGLPAERLKAHLYKLLVYEKGGFFLPHRDSEKLDRMIASMIVVLPNPFDGGRLIVRHNDNDERLSFQEAATGKNACFAVFFADCKHEVEKVQSGVRLVLAYNMVLTPQANELTKNPTTSINPLTEAIKTWFVRQPAEPLVFALEHHYTQAGLSLDLLKGADRKLAEEIVAATENMGAHVQLVQVTRHLSEIAFDLYDEYGYGNQRHTLSNGHRICFADDVIEEELYGTEWTSLDGERNAWGNIGFSKSAIISTIPLNKWKPDAEEYEGYTGNAGNTLDRWYHRSAIAIWHNDHHYDIITCGHATQHIPDFLTMLNRLAKTPKAQREVATAECLRFARAIVTNWPHHRAYYGDPEDAQPTPNDTFADSIYKLHDQDFTRHFLNIVAERDELTPLEQCVIAACHEYGWDAFHQELKQIISPTPNQYGHVRGITIRDLKMLVAVCGDPSKDPEKRILCGELCKLAVSRVLVVNIHADFAEDRTKPYERESLFPILLQALMLCQRDEEISQVISHVRERRLEFSLDYGIAPALKLLIPWSQKQLGQVYPLLQSWFTDVLQELEQATIAEPQPPIDWARPADVSCTCLFCKQLSTYLADPKSEIGRISAAERDRDHVITTMRRHKSDATQTLDCTKRPYTLVLKKTLGSYERAVKRYKMNLNLIRELKKLMKKKRS